MTAQPPAHEPVSGEPIGWVVVARVTDEVIAPPILAEWLVLTQVRPTLDDARQAMPRLRRAAGPGQLVTAARLVLEEEA